MASPKDPHQRKAGAKRKHLACYECNTPLDDSCPYSRCESCRTASTEPTMQEMFQWTKTYVDDSIKGVVQLLMRGYQDPLRLPWRWSHRSKDLPPVLRGLLLLRKKNLLLAFSLQKRRRSYSSPSGRGTMMLTWGSPPIPPVGHSVSLERMRPSSL